MIPPFHFGGGGGGELCCVDLGLVGVGRDELTAESCSRSRYSGDGMKSRRRRVCVLASMPETAFAFAGVCFQAALVLVNALHVLVVLPDAVDVLSGARGRLCDLGVLGFEVALSGCDDRLGCGFGVFGEDAVPDAVGLVDLAGVGDEGLGDAYCVHVVDEVATLSLQLFGCWEVFE